MDEKLIELIRSKPELYDPNHKEYTITPHKNKVWEEIGKVIKKTGTQCKQRWLSLRSQHRKVLRKHNAKNNHGPQFIRKWRYEDSMAFLIDYMREKHRISSFGETEQIIEIEDNAEDFIKYEVDQTSALSDSIPSPSSVTSDIATNSLRNYILPHNPPEMGEPTGKFKEDSRDLTRDKDVEDNSVDLFFLSIAKTVKGFSPLDQHLAKTQIFHIVSQLEAKYLMGDSSPQHNFLNVQV